MKVRWCNTDKMGVHQHQHHGLSRGHCTFALLRPALSILPPVATPKTLGMNLTHTLEAHVITSDDETACFAPGHGQFPCTESVANGGSGAPPFNDTQVGGGFVR